MRELKELFRLGAAYGYSDWLVLDLTVVRSSYDGYTLTMAIVTMAIHLRWL